MKFSSDNDATEVLDQLILVHNVEFMEINLATELYMKDTAVLGVLCLDAFVWLWVLFLLLY